MGWSGCWPIANGGHASAAVGRMAARYLWLRLVCVSSADEVFAPAHPYGVSSMLSCTVVRHTISLTTWNAPVGVLPQSSQNIFLKSVKARMGHAATAKQAARFML